MAFSHNVVKKFLDAAAFGTNFNAAKVKLGKEFAQNHSKSLKVELPGKILIFILLQV